MRLDHLLSKELTNTRREASPWGWVFMVDHAPAERVGGGALGGTLAMSRLACGVWSVRRACTAGTLGRVGGWLVNALLGPEATGRGMSLLE